jgi:hypothetical protein
MGFFAYHQSFYRYVEATSLTPFSGPALERGLSGTLVAMARLGDIAMTPPGAAMDIEKHRTHARDETIRAAITDGRSTTAAGSTGWTVSFEDRVAEAVVSGPRDDANELERRGHELVARGHELLAQAAELRARTAPDEWVPVSASPLGRRQTLHLARRGVVESAKVGRTVVVRASSLNAFIERQRRHHDDEEEDLFDAAAIRRTGSSSR